MRCRPYNISPLQLLAPPSHALSPAEFYRLWQALPHRAQVGPGWARAGGQVAGGTVCFGSARLDTIPAAAAATGVETCRGAPLPLPSAAGGHGKRPRARGPAAGDGIHAGGAAAMVVGHGGALVAGAACPQHLAADVAGSALPLFLSAQT